MSNLPAPRAKVPMGEAALILAQLCDAIDAGADVDAAVQAVFRETRLDLADAVDRRIVFFELLKAQIEAARSARNAWDVRKQELEEMLATLKAKTQEIIEEHPDLPYQGRFGKLAVQKSPPKVETVWGDRELSPEIIQAFGVESRYVIQETHYKLDTRLVKSDLERGVPLAWASIGQGRHLRTRLTGDAS